MKILDTMHNCMKKSFGVWGHHYSYFILQKEAGKSKKETIHNCLTEDKDMQVPAKTRCHPSSPQS